MGRDLTLVERDVLEALIDSAGLVAVLHGLSEVCDEKAQHIQSSYAASNRLDPLAKAWSYAAGKIGCVSCHHAVMAIGEP